MDIVKEMRGAYYRALFGQLKTDGVNVPIFHYQVPKGQNPDVYCIISVSSNTSSDTMASIGANYVVQFSIVAKSLTNPNNVIEPLADAFWDIVQPNKWTCGINPNGMQIVYTQKQIDDTRPSYESSTGQIVQERVIQVLHNIFQK